MNDQEEARRCEWLVLWLDCDREGDNTTFEVYCRAANPHLNIWQACFSALIGRDTHESVQRALYIPDSDITSERYTTSGLMVLERNYLEIENTI